MVSISEPYTLSTLPQSSLLQKQNNENKDKQEKVEISFDNITNSLAQISCQLLNNQFIINLAVSQSAILRYTLLPAPRIIESFAISPSYIVTSVSSIDFNNNIDDNDNSLNLPVYIGIKDKKKKFIYGYLNNSNSEEIKVTTNIDNDVSGLYIINLNSSDKNSLNLSSSSSFSSSSYYILAVLESSYLKLFSKDLKKEFWTHKAKASRRIIYSCFVSHENVTKEIISKFPQSAGTSLLESVIDNGVLILISKRDVGKKSIYEVRIISINVNGAHDLISKEIIAREDVFDEYSSFEYKNGFLLRLIPSKSVLVAYNIGNMQESFKINLLNITNKLTKNHIKKTSNDQTKPLFSSSFVSIDNDQVLISLENHIFLINTRLNSLISYRTLEYPVMLKKYYKELGSVIAFSATSSTQSSFNTKTLSLPQFEVSVINISPGKGTLLESMGEGIIGSNDNLWINTFCDITQKKQNYNINNPKLVSDLLLSVRATNDNIIKQLTLLREKKDLVAWETRVVPYLSGECEWIDVDSKVSEITTSNLKVYDSDTSREVDPILIQKIVGMIFETIEIDTEITVNSSNNIELSNNALSNSKQITTRVIDKEFVPEISLVYLLTHPLFPSTLYPGLIQALWPFPRLLRQALVTCPGLLCSDVLLGLSHPSDDIFKDTVTRLTEEFPRKMIVRELGTLQKNTFSGEKNTIIETKNVNDISEYASFSDPGFILERIKETNIGWEIADCFVDFLGIFYWTSKPDSLKNLRDEVDNQVNQIMGIKNVDQLLVETLRRVKAKPFKKSKLASNKQIGLNETGSHSSKNSTVLNKQQINNDLNKVPKSSNNTQEYKPGVVLSEVQQKMGKMQGLLSLNPIQTSVSQLGDNSSQLSSKEKRLIKGRQGEEISRKVGKYTIEKLII